MRRGKGTQAGDTLLFTHGTKVDSFIFFDILFTEIFNEGGIFMKPGIIFLGIVVIICMCSFATADSYEMFLKPEGIQGETSFLGEPGWISVLTWEWASGRSILETNVSVTRTSYTGPKMESVRSLDGLGITFSKLVDRTSAALLSNFKNKIKIPSAKLCIRMVVGGKETTWTYDLKNVMITSQAQKGNKETLTLTLRQDHLGQKITIRIYSQSFPEVEDRKYLIE